MVLPAASNSFVRRGDSGEPVAFLRETKMKLEIAVAALTCLLFIGSSVQGQVVGGVMTVTGAEMH